MQFTPLREVSLFTPGQLSDMLSLPPSTLRRYVKQFTEHLSEQATKKRGRRFTERDVAVLARARELIQQGRSPEETAALLQVVEDESTSNESALALVPSISKALTEALDTARALRSEVGDLSDQVEEVARAQGTTDDELLKLREWLTQPWYRRLFGKPPD